MKSAKFSVMALFALLATGCADAPNMNYTIEGKATLPALEGRTVYMQDALVGDVRYDSATVLNGVFRFEGKRHEPVVRELFIQQNDSDMFPVTLPFVLEPGRIEVDLGERVYVGNTDLNKEMMDVLMAFDAFRDRDFTGKSIDDMKADFSVCLMEQIVKHSNNVIGKYLFEAFQVKLTEEQKKEAEKTLGM